MTKTQRVSAIDRLRTLPEVITLPHLSSVLSKQDESATKARQKASVYLSNWVKRGYIEPIGARAGVYFNLIKNTNARSDNWFVALKMVYPSAITIGASSLHQAGLTTQIPRSHYIAVMQRPSYISIDGYSISARTRSWYQDMREFITPNVNGIAMLKPEAAIADGWASKANGQTGVWNPDPDDLEIYDINWDLVQEAAFCLNVEPPEWFFDLHQELSPSSAVKFA